MYAVSQDYKINFRQNSITNNTFLPENNMLIVSTADS